MTDGNSPADAAQATRPQRPADTQAEAGAPTASELGRRLAAQRRPKTVACPICGRVVVGLGRRTYCSPACAKLAWWRRNRAPGATGKAAGAPPDRETP